MTDLRANLGAHRAAGLCEHCHAFSGQKHDRSCPKARQGRTARQRGNDFERQLVHWLSEVYPDARRTGMYGGPDDVLAGPLYVQAKKVKSIYPKRLARLLKDTEEHCTADQLPLVALAYPGHEGQPVLAVVDFRDLVALLNEATDD